MGVPPGLTEDGYEPQFGTNHMGPALLTKLLPTLLKTADLPGADVRIMNLNSEAFKFGPKAGLLLSQNKTPLAELGGAARYGQSKLANPYFTQSLAKLYPSISSNAIHPGFVRTGIADNTTTNYPYLSWVFALTFRLLWWMFMMERFRSCLRRRDPRTLWGVDIFISQA
jgi:NAD(P)-dependent dehydrogenase (short-subunit alcohol dehydrogenase family)